YNSCRNRHCPKCQWSAAAAWLAARKAELLPVPYFHVVFTLPAGIGAIAYQNKAEVYGLLFTAAAETLATIAADPKHLGANIGITAVLHTWGQNLQHHPHVHCIVPGGGPSPDGQRWIACKPGFFLPVRVLSRLFRRLFLQSLEAMHTTGQLQFFGDCAPLKDADEFRAYLAPLRKAEWVVYAKKAFRRPRAGPGLSRALYASCRDRQQPLARFRRDPCPIPLEGLSRSRSLREEGPAPRCRRVHAPLPAPHAAERIAFATMASLPTAIAPTSSRFVETYSMCSRHRRIAITMMTIALTPSATNRPGALAAVGVMTTVLPLISAFRHPTPHRYRCADRALEKITRFGSMPTCLHHARSSCRNRPAAVATGGITSSACRCRAEAGVIEGGLRSSPTITRRLWSNTGRLALIP